MFAKQAYFELASLKHKPFKHKSYVYAYIINQSFLCKKEAARFLGRLNKLNKIIKNYSTVYGRSAT